MYSVKGRVCTSSAAVIVAMRRALLPLVVASCVLLSLFLSLSLSLSLRKSRERAHCSGSPLRCVLPEEKSKSFLHRLSRAAFSKTRRKKNIDTHPKHSPTKKGKKPLSLRHLDKTLPSQLNTIKIDTKGSIQKTRVAPRTSRARSQVRQ